MASVHSSTSPDTAEETRKLGVLVTILFVSLFAVSFPGLSKRTPFLRIPGLVFFVGKHFGTGVILATAFIHLLGDAFSSLQKEEVTRRYGPVGKWTGCIILCSLLVIFLVEYISTLYVEHLNDHPSAPSTPATSREGSVPPEHRLPVVNINENTPLLVAASDDHRCHHPTVIPTMALNGVPVELLTGSPRVCRLSIGHISQHEAHHHDVHEEDQQPKIGRKRQVIGILVLQLGIMIHSLVIGMTLVVTYGSDFTSLTTAIIFHQLFEGLSLGIRIAALPPAKHSHDDLEDADTFDSETLPPSLSPRGSSSHKRKWTSPGSALRSRLCHWATHFRRVRWLKPTMAILFGLTTPAGMGLGMLIWGSGHSAPKEDAAMSLVQGIMSAVSAGLLIYASTVEMLAGDFVYGDVDGGHHHHHHAHDDDEDHEHHHDGDAEHAHDHHHEHHHKQHSHHQPQPQCSKDALRTPSPPHRHPLSKSISADSPTASPVSLPAPVDAGAPPVCLAITNADTQQSISQIGVNDAHKPSLPNSSESEKPAKASLRKRLLALGSLAAGVFMMVLVGLGE